MEVTGTVGDGKEESEAEDGRTEFASVETGEGEDGRVAASGGQAEIGADVLLVRDDEDENVGV